jgi:O-antigen/teichoic acid export membrane protein
MVARRFSESARPAPAVTDTLRSRVLGGLAWKAASQIVAQVSRLGVAVVLAHMLAPRQFGLAAMALVFSSFVLVFSDVALGAALVQRRDLSEEHRSTAFWTSVGIGAFFTALGVACSGPIASFYGEPTLQPLVAALSFAFVLTSLAATQEALLIREMAFRSLEVRMMASAVVSGGAGIAAAAAGWGAWALIVQQLALAGASTVLIWIVSPWRPRFVYSLQSLRSLGGFSFNVFLQRIVYYAHRNVDNLLIGRFVGAAALGAYAFSYNVMLVPFSRVAGPIQEVLFPALSRMQDDRDRMLDIWVRATRVTGALSIPALAGLAIVAPDFVHVVLGEKWRAAAPVLQILAWVGLLQSLQTLNSNILTALDRTSTLLRYAIVFLAAHLVAFGVGIHWGVLGVATSYAVSTTLVEPLYAWLTARALGASPFAVARGLAGVVQASAAMVACVLPARLLHLDAGVGPTARLALLVTLGLAVYLPCCAWRAPALVAELRRRRPAGVALAPA